MHFRQGLIQASPGLGGVKKNTVILRFRQGLVRVIPGLAGQQIRCRQSQFRPRII